MRPSLKDRGTLTDVAKAVGVSVASVSYAFSRPDQLSPELRQKILATARSLNDLGHKRFAIVTFPLHIDEYTGPIDRGRLRKAGFEVARRRMQGYLSVIESAGTKTSMKIWECLRSSEEDGRTAGEFFLENKPRPTAILATSDRLALGVMEFART